MNSRPKLPKGGDLDRSAEIACALIAKARPIFAGQPIEAIGAALAELAAIWLACHQASDRSALERWREDALDRFADCVRELVPIMEEELGL